MTARIRPGIATTFFVLFVGPGPVAGVVPWLLSRWKLEEPFLGWKGIRWIGAVFFLAGLPVLGEALVRFVRDGRGTPAPVLPPERLVVTGLYRYVRNPMYVGVSSMIVGQGLFLGNLPVLLYAAGMAIAFQLFVRLHEEPGLRRRFGAEYEAYCRGVRRWRPRFTPWTPAAFPVPTGGAAPIDSPGARRSPT